MTRGHIDGCILAHPANLVFAEKMAALGARTSIPTTTNAISVDQCGWQQQGIDKDFDMLPARLQPSIRKWGRPDIYLRPICWSHRP